MDFNAVAPTTIKNPKSKPLTARGAPPLEKMDETDNVLLKVLGKLNERKYRAIDFFRTVDRDSDGTCTHEELREGLKKMDLNLSDQDFSKVVARLDDNFSGDMDAKEFDKEMKIVGKKARAENRHDEVDTWSLSLKATAKAVLALSPQKTPRSQGAVAEQDDGRLPDVVTRKLPAPFKDKPPVAPQLEKLDAGDNVMLRILGKLNERKYRAIDFFRTIDVSGDGLCTLEELRTGLNKMDCRLSDEDFAIVVARLDDNNSGDVDPKEFDQEMKLVGKKARAENRHNEVDTWPLKRPPEDNQRGRYSWAHRSVSTTTSASWSTYGTPSALKLPTPWSASASGPSGTARCSTVGSGSIFDTSIHRERLFDALPAPGANQQSLAMSQLPLHRNQYWRATHRGRFESEPTELPHSKMMATRDSCRTSTRGAFKSIPVGGVKTFMNTPMMQSTVDQVVFNRDMDFSGEEKFDEDFTAMFDGMAGMPSWYWGR